jgi:hypothetical protein
LQLVISSGCFKDADMLDWIVSEQSLDATTESDFASLLNERSETAQRVGHNRGLELVMGKLYGNIPSD